MSYLVNKESSLCLDGRENGNIYTISCVNRPHQNWSALGDNLVLSSTGGCLKAVSNNNVAIDTCDQQSAEQRWISIGKNLQNEYNVLCLRGAENGKVVKLAKCDYDGAEDQMWSWQHNMEILDVNFIGDNTEL